MSTCLYRQSQDSLSNTHYAFTMIFVSLTTTAYGQIFTHAHTHTCWYRYRYRYKLYSYGYRYNLYGL